MTDLHFYDLANYDPTPEGAAGKAELEWWHCEDIIPAWVREEVGDMIRCYVEKDLFNNPAGRCHVFTVCVLGQGTFARLTEMGLFRNRGKCRFVVTEFSRGPGGQDDDQWALLLALKEDHDGCSACYPLRVPIIPRRPEGARSRGPVRPRPPASKSLAVVA